MRNLGIEPLSVLLSKIMLLKHQLSVRTTRCSIGPGNDMSLILMKFGAEVSFMVRTRKQVLNFPYQSLVAMEKGYLILAIFVHFGHEKSQIFTDFARKYLLLY